MKRVKCELDKPEAEFYPTKKPCKRCLLDRSKELSQQRKAIRDERNKKNEQVELVKHEIEKSESSTSWGSKSLEKYKKPPRCLVCKDDAGKGSGKCAKHGGNKTKTTVTRSSRVTKTIGAM